MRFKWMDCWRKEQGNLTVEASFVFPIVFFVLLGVIYFTFYMMDKDKAYAVVDTYAQKQAVCLKEHCELSKDKDYSKITETGIFYYLDTLKEEEATLEGEITKKLKEELLIGKVNGVSAKLSYSGIEVNAKVEMNIGISQVKEYFTGTPLEYTVSVAIPVHDPSEFARAYKVIGETIDHTKGLATIKEQLTGIKKTAE